MGKSTDKLYITHGEWKSGQIQGGLTREKYRQNLQDKEFKRLPFDHCSLSLRPFEHPVCTRDGVVYDLEEIERHLRLYGEACPVTGKPLQLKDLCRMRVDRNAAGEYQCPVSGRVFGESTRVLCNWKTGSVYAEEAVEEMLKLGRDFCDDSVRVKRSDFVVLVDPSDLRTRNYAKFGNCVEPSVNDKPQINKEEEEESDHKHKHDQTDQSLGRVAASLTSTAMPISTKQEFRKSAGPSVTVTCNAELVIRTTHGDMEAVIMAPRCPLAAYNLIELSKRGDYCGCPLVSLGDGRLVSGATESGISIYGKPFRDELHPTLKHDRRGVLAMVPGLHQNDNSTQFYVTLTPAPHLDGTAVVFGHLKMPVSEPTLAALEQSLTVSGQSEYCAIVDIIVMKDPFAMAEREKAVTLRKHLRDNATVKERQMETKSKDTRIGKYLNL